MSQEPRPPRPTGAGPTAEPGHPAGTAPAAQTGRQVGVGRDSGTSAGPKQTGATQPAASERAETKPAARRSVMLRLDPAVHDALTRWAADELRSVNAQVELVLRRALSEAGRAPHGAAPLPQRGRPRHP